MACALSAVAQTESARQAAVPYPHAGMPAAIDLGRLAAQPDAGPISLTVTLRINDLKAAQDLLTALYTPGDPQFHQFLTGQEFAARFLPGAAEVQRVIAAFASYGLAAERTSSTTLRVTGTAADIERAFAVSLHQYQVPAQGSAAAYTYHAPLARPAIPAEIFSSISAVAGLDTRPSLHPMHVNASSAFTRAPRQASASTQGNPPGVWTVTDFANYYDVQPLYKAGLSGKGHTLGIITLASFSPSDAFAYWNALGLRVDPKRLTVVNVDGGPGAPSDASGSVETTLDVEQSGGIAPGAKIIVYQAPNTSQAFLDLFAAAVETNAADTLSTSWGEWEWFDNLDNSPVTDPITGQTVSAIQATHELLLRAAIQGQSVFAAAGDSGAYDVFSACSPQYCSEPLSVDYPASDSFITAGGGTTLAGTQTFCLDSGCNNLFSVNVPAERVWGWDYLQPLCNVLGAPDPVSCGIFPVGTGGGVSVFFDRPLYQLGLAGTQLSQPNQNFSFEGQLLFSLPAHFPGRNVPDVSLNADPDTGYVILYTSNVNGPEALEFYGGTSFVAPQLNGVTALLDESLGHGRVGLLNFPLYALALTGQAYRKPNAPLNVISTGNNWFYTGTNGYSPAAGLGTLDVANFAARLHAAFGRP